MSEMIEIFSEKIARELHLQPWQVFNTLKLMAGGATIPFIARYRKEMTGELDEVMLAAIRDRNQQLTEIEKRRAFILSSITEQDKKDIEFGIAHGVDFIAASFVRNAKAIQEIRNIIEFQMVFSLFSLALGNYFLPKIGIPQETIDIYDLLIFAAYSIAIMQIIVIILLYFDDKIGALTITAFFLVANAMFAR